MNRLTSEALKEAMQVDTDITKMDQGQLKQLIISLRSRMDEHAKFLDEHGRMLHRAEKELARRWEDG